MVLLPSCERRVASVGVTKTDKNVTKPLESHLEASSFRTCDLAPEQWQVDASAPGFRRGRVWVVDVGVPDLRGDDLLIGTRPERLVGPAAAEEGAKTSIVARFEPTVAGGRVDRCDAAVVSGSIPSATTCGPVAYEDIGVHVS